MACPPGGVETAPREWPAPACAASEGALARLGMATGTRGWHILTSINAVALLQAFGVYAVGILNGRRMRPGASG